MIYGLTISDWGTYDFTKNGYARQINRKMYRQKFNQDYNPTMLKTLAAQGLYPDEIEGIS